MCVESGYCEITALKEMTQYMQVDGCVGTAAWDSLAPSFKQVSIKT